jgi:Na+-transporting methylmalonyl-CoA/oxaloacetate decarboxylase gamma subunit
MSTILGDTILIALTGMALVLVAILFFWAFIAGLVRLAGRREAGEAEADTRASPVAQAGPADLDPSEVDLRCRAALVAVAVALAQKTEEAPRPFPMPAMPLVSTWQSVNRARLLGRRGAVR